MFKRINRSLRILLGLLIVALMLALHPASPAYAASFTVTSTGDQPDSDLTDGLCRIARSNQCTLRAAIQQANASPGNDTITFNLGNATISPSSALPDLTDDKGVTIRGDRNITLEGSRGVSIGLRILNSRQNKIQGLIIRNFNYGVMISGELFNVASFNIIGTDGDGMNDTSERNVIRDNVFGVYIFGIGSNHNTIAGNYIGTNPAGTDPAANRYGVWIGDFASYTWVGTNSDGIADGAEGNVISGNNTGIAVDRGGSVTIAGNLVGLAANGTGALPNDSGITLRMSSLNLIGTNGDGIADTAERNVISSNTTAAIQIDAVSETTIAGNFIGTPADGGGDRGNGAGIIIYESSENGTSTNNMIGGDTAAEGNLITHNGTGGVVIRGELKAAAQPSGNSILSNSMFDNDILGIDLVAIPTTFTVDPNDPGDADFGPNNMMNHPEILTAVTAGGVTTVRAQIVSGLPNAVIRVQFFSAPGCENQGTGEGRVFLDTTLSTFTDAGGNVTFQLALPVTVSVGNIVTSTATDAAGNTSEFSPCVTVTNN
jgi:CSLREA domain-containing protein